MSSGSRDAGEDDGNADARPPFAGESTADALIEHRVSGEQVFAGALLDVRRDRVRLPDGGDAIRFGHGSVWLSNLRAANVWRLDPKRIVATLPE